jgi:hypothetical protein
MRAERKRDSTEDTQQNAKRSPKARDTTSSAQKVKKKTVKKNDGYWSKLDRAELRKVKFYIFSIEITLLVIITLNAMYESMIIEPFYFPIGYLLLFILLLIFLITAEGIWFKYLSIKNAKSYKKRSSLIKQYRGTAQKALAIAVIILIIILSLNFLPFVSDLIKTKDSFEFRPTQREELKSFEDQDFFGLTHTNNINFNSNNTVELKLSTREISSDEESVDFEEDNLGNHTSLEYSLSSPDYQLGYTPNKEYHFFITNIASENVSGNYEIQREISKTFTFNVLLFMLLIIIVSVVWLGYLNSARKKYEKLYEEKLAEATKRYAVKPFTIEDVFLIYRDGTLITHQTRRIKPMDNDILSGMLTAGRF